MNKDQFAYLNMEIKDLEAERDNLKAELEEAWVKNGRSLRAWLREKGRAEKAEAMASKLAEVLKDVSCYFDESRDDCGICDKGLFGGHHAGCVVPDVLKALAAYAKEQSDKGEEGKSNG